MSITLRPEHEKAISQAIQSGAYQNSDQVLERALELLRFEDGWLHAHKEEIAQKIDRAFGQFEHGEFLSSEDSRTDMEKRKAAWLAEHKH